MRLGTIPGALPFAFPCQQPIQDKLLQMDFDGIAAGSGDPLEVPDGHTTSLPSGFEDVLREFRDRQQILLPLKFFRQGVRLFL